MALIVESEKTNKVSIGAYHEIMEWMINAVLNVWVLGMAQERIVKHYIEKMKEYRGHEKAPRSYKLEKYVALYHWTTLSLCSEEHDGGAEREAKE